MACSLMAPVLAQIYVVIGHHLVTMSYYLLPSYDKHLRTYHAFAQSIMFLQIEINIRDSNNKLSKVTPFKSVTASK